MKTENLARLLLLVLVAVALAIPAARYGLPSPAGTSVELHARLPENGGWSPETLTVPAGQELHLRLTSDDVMHGFAVGKSDQPSVDVVPGKFSELSLSFAEPGTYTYYCTRWCGVNHWRMRGIIQVTGEPVDRPAPAPPLYARLGLDLDAPPPALPGDLSDRPSAARGAALGISIPAAFTMPDYRRAHSPADLFTALRAERLGAYLTDRQLWDLVAFAWQGRRSPDALARGSQLYAENCAACHGETGGGDGVMAGALLGASPSPASPPPGDFGYSAESPTNFTDSRRMLALNSARLQGKIIRGGMGTGMPYWGPIFTEEQTWALVDFLWTFAFDAP